MLISEVAKKYNLTIVEVAQISQDCYDAFESDFKKDKGAQRIHYWAYWKLRLRNIVQGLPMPKGMGLGEIKMTETIEEFLKDCRRDYKKQKIAYLCLTKNPIIQNVPPRCKEECGQLSFDDGFPKWAACIPKSVLPIIRTQTVNRTGGMPPTVEDGYYEFDWANLAVGEFREYGYKDES